MFVFVFVLTLIVFCAQAAEKKSDQSCLKDDFECEKTNSIKDEIKSGTFKKKISFCFALKIYFWIENFWFDGDVFEKLVVVTVP